MAIGDKLFIADKATLDLVKVDTTDVLDDTAILKADTAILKADTALLKSDASTLVGRGGGVKSVQRGTLTVSGTVNTAVTIAEISSLSKASVSFITLAHAATSNGYYVANINANLTTVTKLQITGSTSTNEGTYSINLTWQVIEYY